jgi:DNA-binding CsgD family transcriptional regulator
MVAPEFSQLRPLERRILRLSSEGITDGEIALRFRRSPQFVRRVMEFAHLPRTGRPERPDGGLRPLEERILWWRQQGANYADIGSRFHRSPQFIERVEAIARYKLAAN